MSETTSTAAGTPEPAAATPTPPAVPPQPGPPAVPPAPATPPAGSTPPVPPSAPTPPATVPPAVTPPAVTPPAVTPPAAMAPAAIVPQAMRGYYQPMPGQAPPGWGQLPPVPPTFVRRPSWWRGPSGPAGRYAIGAVAAAALVAAISVRMSSFGVGWTIAAYAATAGIFVGTWYSRRAGAASPETATAAPSAMLPAIAPGPLAPGAIAPGAQAPDAIAPGAQAPAAIAPAAAGQATATTPAAESTTPPAPTPPAPPIRRRAVSPDDATGPEPRSERVFRYFWGASALALAAVPTIRAAGWLVALCVIAAFVCASLALGGGRYARGLILGVISLVVGVFEGVPWITSGTARSGSKGDPGKTGRLILTIIVSLVLLAIFGGLFAAADPAFKRVMSDILPNLDPPSIIRTIAVFLFVVGLTAGGVWLRAGRLRLDAARGGDPKTLGRFEWMLPVVLLDLMFALFLVIQAEALLSGEKFIHEMASVDYKEYVRQGFGQLVAVTVLTLLVIGLGARRAARTTPGDRLAVRLVFGPLCLMTLGVVASALVRMLAYSDKYGYTRLRVLGSVLEIWMGVVILLVLVAGLALRSGGWLPRTILASFIVTLIGVAAANPDGYVAKLNVDRFYASQDNDEPARINLQYLSTLSADAVPELERLPDDYRVCVLKTKVVDRDTNPQEWQSYNLGRDRALAILDKYPDYEDASCDRYHEPYLGD